LQKKPFLPTLRISPKVTPVCRYCSESLKIFRFPWKIGAITAAESSPNVIPGMAGIFNAMARITTSGGRSNIGLMLKLFLSPSISICAWEVSAVPPDANRNPINPKNTSAIA